MPKKYEEEHYRYENIKEHIYPWVKENLTDHKALNGKSISAEDTPVVAFVGNLKIIFVIQRGEEVYEIVKDNMLPPNHDIEQMYHTACENLVRDVEFVISNTLYGAFGIIADGYHEASSLCLKHIWQVCVDKLKDDLVIMAPSKDIVVFAPAGQENVVGQMIEFGQEAYRRSRDKVSVSLMLFSKDRKELTIYDKKC